MLQVHQPDKPNPLLGVLGDVAFPLLVIAGLLFLRSRSSGGGGIPGLVPDVIPREVLFCRFWKHLEALMEKMV